MSVRALTHAYKTYTKGTARLLLMVLADYADDDGRGRMAMINAIHYTRMNREAVRRALNTLHKEGVLSWVRTQDAIDYEIRGVSDE